MTQARNGGVTLQYDTFGVPSDPPLLLIMGLGAQLTAWEEPFCQLLAGGGYFVVRFDNRDTGLSSKTAGDPPDVAALFMRALTGQDIGPVPYTLSDMAGDAVAVLDALGLHRAHVVGASMGGMIAQMVAIEHRDRLASLTSIMSTTGAPGVGAATPEALGALLAPRPTERTEAIETAVKTWRIISGQHFDEAATRVRVAAAYDRCFYPQGAAFQLAAIAKVGDRTERLGLVQAPALVIHGRQDTLVNFSGGEATAAALAGSRLLLVEDMGHDLSPPLWPVLTRAVLDHVGDADALPS